MMIKDNNLLREMLKDMNNADYHHGPGSYWQSYMKDIVKELETKDLNEFKNWKGGGGKGSIATLGGGKVFYIHSSGWNFHPFDDDFIKFDSNLIIRKINRLIDKLSIYLPFVKFFSVRSAIARIY